MNSSSSLYLRIKLRRMEGMRRFLKAQDREIPLALPLTNTERLFEPPPATVYERAIDEMRYGRKLTHWVWFVFPQEVGLGSSLNSRVYGLTPREALRYLNHPVLSDRLTESFEALCVGVAKSGSLSSVLGKVDAKKAYSCLRLFESVSPGFTSSLRSEFRFFIGVS